MSFLEKKLKFLPPWSRVLIMTSPLCPFSAGLNVWKSGVPYLHGGRVVEPLKEILWIPLWVPHSFVTFSLSATFLEDLENCLSLSHMLVWLLCLWWIPCKENGSTHMAVGFHYGLDRVHQGLHFALKRIHLIICHIHAVCVGNIILYPLQ